MRFWRILCLRSLFRCVFVPSPNACLFHHVILGLYDVWRPPASEVLRNGLFSEVTTFGLLLGVIFAVNHESDLIRRQDLPESLAQDPFAVQAVESVNYEAFSWASRWCLGFLNYQIEHHIFPGLHPLWYPRLAPIVKEACLSLGVP